MAQDCHGRSFKHNWNVLNFSFDLISMTNNVKSSLEQELHIEPRPRSSSRLHEWTRLGSELTSRISSLHANPRRIDGINDVTKFLALVLGVVFGRGSTSAQSIIVAELLLAPLASTSHHHVHRSGTIAVTMTSDDTFSLFQTARRAGLVLPWWPSARELHVTAGAALVHADSARAPLNYKQFFRNWHSCYTTALGQFQINSSL